MAWKWPISSDFLFYAASLRVFSAQFWSGEMYPRWLTDTNAGFGSPVFVFYSPLSFYIASFLEFLAPLDPHGFGRILISMTLALFTAGLTCHRWLKMQVSAENAQKGALLYAAFPYLMLSIYGGFAAPQLWSVALFPLLLETAERLIDKGWRALPGFALAYAALCFTHLPSLLIFGAVPCAYAVYFSPRERRWRQTGLAALGTGLGVALAAVYWLPAIKNKPFITSERFLDANLVYSHNFLDSYSLIGIALLILPLMGLFIETPKETRREFLTGKVRFWLYVQAALLFMALPLSKPVWDILPPLQHLQFPFRFFLGMLPGTVFVALAWLPEAKSRRLYHSLFAVMLVCAAVYSEETAFFRSKQPARAILEDRLLARPEYQTRWMEQANIDVRTRVPERYRTMEAASFTLGSGSVALIGQDARHITLRAHVTSPEAIVTLKRFYFPGWQAAPGSFAPGTLSVAPSRPLLSLWLPQGNYMATLELPWFAGEREGMAISLLAGLVMAGWQLAVGSWRLRVRGNEVLNESELPTANRQPLTDS